MQQLSSEPTTPAVRGVTRRRIVRWRDGSSRPTIDALAPEEPLEIRLDGQAVTTTMRSPGDDVDLAIGWCIAEGLVDPRPGSPAGVAGARYCVGRDPEGRQTYNVVEVARRVPAPVAEGSRRLHATTSACGVCGTADVDAVAAAVPAVDAAATLRLSAGAVLDLPDRLRRAQRVFEQTGGLHAAGLFDADGEPLVVREDVGRHNAVDKVLGHAAQTGGLPASDAALVVSGRVAFEIVQKAARAGTPVVVAVSAPTALAVRLADRVGITVAGFVRGSSMNVYSHPDRIVDR